MRGKNIVRDNTDLLDNDGRLTNKDMASILNWTFNNVFANKRSELSENWNAYPDWHTNTWNTSVLTGKQP